MTLEPRYCGIAQVAVLSTATAPTSQVADADKLASQGYQPD